MNGSFRAGQSFLKPQDDAVEKAQLAGHPRQAVGENQASYEKKQSAAEEFDGVKMFSEALVKAQELADAERGEQKRNGQASGVHGEKENAAGDGVAGGGERQHGRENWSDARSPPEGKGKAEEKTAPDARLRAAGAETNVAVEPARHGRAKETNQREREEMNVSETSGEWAAAEERDDAKQREHAAQDEADANSELGENAKKVQAEENNQRAGDGGQQGAILAKKRSDGAG